MSFKEKNIELIKAMNELPPAERGPVIAAGLVGGNETHAVLTSLVQINQLVSGIVAEAHEEKETLGDYKTVKRTLEMVFKISLNRLGDEITRDLIHEFREFYQIQASAIN